MARDNIFNINLKFASDKVEAGLARITNAFGKLNERLKLTNKGLEETTTKSKGLFSQWQKGIIVWNQALELVRKLGFAFEKMKVPLLEAGQFEQFRVTLQNLIGDTETAQKRFEDLVKFAAVTPFNVPGVVEAGNRLQALGVYSLDTIRNLGDLAAASGKNVMQAVEAYTNMITGRTGIAVKQFRALLISTDDWTRAIGKSVLQNAKGAKASIQEMMDALPEIIERKNFIGLMDQQSKTLLGRLSNLEDAWQQLMATIGDEFIETAKEFTDWMIEFFEVAKVEIPRIIALMKDWWEIIKYVGSAILVLKGGVKVFQLLYTASILFTKGLIASAAAVKGMTAATFGATMATHGLSAALSKVMFILGKNPFVLAVTGIVAVTGGILAWKRITEENIEVQIKENEVMIRKNKLRMEEEETLLSGNKRRKALLEQYIELAEAEENLTEHSEDYLKVLSDIKNEYPYLVDEINSGNFTVETATEMIGKLERNVNNLGTSLGNLSTITFNLELDNMRNNIRLLIADLKESVDNISTFGDWITNVFDKIGSAFTAGVTGDNSFIEEQMKRENFEESRDNFEDQMDAFVLEVENIGDKGLEGIQGLTERIMNALYSAEEKDIISTSEFDTFYNKFRTALGKQLDFVNRDAEGVIETEFEKLNRLLNDDYKKIKDTESIQALDLYIEQLQEAREKVGSLDTFEIGGQGFTPATQGIDDRDTTKRTQQKQQAFRIALDNDIIRAQRLRDGMQKEIDENKKAADQARNARYKEYLEKFKSLQEDLKAALDDGVLTYEEFFARNKKLSDDFDEMMADNNINQKDYNSKEKGLHDDMRDFEEETFKKRNAILKKGITDARVLYDMDLATAKELRTALEEEKEKILDVATDGGKISLIDIKDEDTKKLIIAIERALKTAQSEVDKKGLLEFNANIKAEGATVDSILEEFNKLDEKTKGIIDSLYEETDRILKSEFQDALKEVYKLPAGDDRDRALLQEEIGYLEKRIKVMERVAESAQKMADSTDKGTEAHDQALDTLNKTTDEMKELANEVENLKEKVENIGLSFGEMFDNVLRGMKALTTELGRASKMWFDVVQESVDKQVEAWLEGQMIMIDGQEKRAEFFARTEQQQQQIKEDYEKRRKDAEEEAEMMRYEKLKSWWELNKAVSIAQAIVNTAVAVTKALEAGPIIGPILAVGVGASGAAQVAAIESQTFPEGNFGEGGWTGDQDEKKIAGVVHGQEFVVKKGPAERYRHILNAMNEGTLEQYLNGGLVNGGGMPLININKDIAMREYARSMDKEMASEIKKMNKNLEEYLKNPVPVRAYLDNREAEKITKQGLKKVRRSTL